MINNNDRKVLQFRDELLELLEKYKYELSGSGFDDGSMIINDENTSYLMDDKISIKKEVWGTNTDNYDYKYEYVMDDYIKDFFKGESREMSGLNNVKVTGGIFTDNEYIARNTLLDLIGEFGTDNVRKFINSKDRIELILMDNSRYVWIKVKNYSKGYRVGKAYIDRNVTLEQLSCIIAPICVYCGKDDITVI